MTRGVGDWRSAGLLNKLGRLAASGQGWARETDDAVFLYASAAGFTREMEGLAAADPRIRLLALRDLYADDELTTGGAAGAS